MDFSEHVDDEVTASANRHWRDVAEYSRYVMPLRVRLQAVKWPIVLAWQSARWRWEALRAVRIPILLYDYCASAPSHLEVSTAIESRNLGKERWISSYYNPRAGKCRRIQRYPLLYVPATKDKRNAGTHPVRFYPPEGPPAEDGFWFRLDDLKSTGWTPEAPAWRIYKTYKEKVGKWLVRRDTLQRNGPNRRQDLADRLRSISQELGYIKEDYQDANGTLVKGFYKLKIELKGALTIDDKTGELYKVDPATLGKVEAKLEHFQRCLREFHEAEKPAPAALPETAHPAEAPAGNPAPMPPLAGPMEVHDAEPASEHPWAEIEALAEKIELRKNGRFLVPGNRVAAAGAGLIDALLDAGILLTTLTRPILYADFTRHYGQSIRAERTKPTRTYWHQKARQELGLPDLKPPKKQV